MDRVVPKTTVCILVACLALGACDEEESLPTADSAAALDWMTTRHFGADTDATRIVARVGAEEISIGDVAVCLEYMPAASPAQCLDRLVDDQLVLQHATDVDRDDARVDDARKSGLAFAFLRDAIERPLSEAPVSDAAITEFMVNPGTRPFIDIPELRECSHILVQGEAGDESALGFARQLHANVDWSSVRSGADLVRIADEYRSAAEELQLSIRVESGLSYPPYSDPATHGGLSRAVREFSDTLFGLDQIGAVSAPVVTEFGVHIVLLEGITPARQLAPEEARFLAIHELTQRQRAETMDALSGETTARHEIVWYDDNLAYLGSQYDAVLQQHSEQLREEIAPDD